MNRSLGVLALTFPLFLQCATPGQAQTDEVRFGYPELSVWIDLLSPKELGAANDQVPGIDSKDLARAKFDAAHADPEQLARAMLEAARISYDAREKEFLAGRGTLDFLLDSSRRLLEAERAVLRDRAEQVAALERYWAHCLLHETLNQERYQAQRIPIQDFLLTRFTRLEAELWLAEARTWSEEASDRPSSSSRALGNPLERKELAKAKLRAAQADPSDLARAKVKAARGMYEARIQEFLAGRGTEQFLQDSMECLVAAELALLPNRGDRSVVLEKLWEQATKNYALQRERYEAGRLPIRPLVITNYFRLDAEIRWARARGREKDVGPGKTTVTWGEEFGPLGVLEIPRAKFKAVHADLAEVAREKPWPVEIFYDTGLREFLAGRGNLIFLQDAAQRILQAFWDLYPRKEDRMAALERYWEQLFFIDRWMQQRYEAGRVPLYDVMWSRYARWQAEAGLARAKKP